MGSKVPFRRSPEGRTAQLKKRKKIPIVSNIQGHHEGFRKIKASAAFVAPVDGVLYGFVVLSNLKGHANALVKFEKGSNLEFPAREGRTSFPKTDVIGGDTIRVYIKPVEETADVKKVRIGILFKETL